MTQFKRLLPILAVTSLFDATSTFYGMSRWGAAFEGNPVMRYLFDSVGLLAPVLYYFVEASLISALLLLFRVGLFRDGYANARDILSIILVFAPLAIGLWNFITFTWF